MRVFTTKKARKALNDNSTYEVALIDPDANEKGIGEILQDNRRKKEESKDVDIY